MAQTVRAIVAVTLIVALSASSEPAHADSANKRPNVLFIAVDDLNDWVGCLGGHPQAKTPNIDRLAEKGVLFEQAYCAERDDLDGRSLAPLVHNPEAAWPWPAIISHSPRWHGTNLAIRSERYHYIRYVDGGEELYDMSIDPHQWRNLADSPPHGRAKEELKSWLSKESAGTAKCGTAPTRLIVPGSRR